jgi:hypothetical protein
VFDAFHRLSFSGWIAFIRVAWLMRPKYRGLVPLTTKTNTGKWQVSHQGIVLPLFAITICRRYIGGRFP